MKIIIIVLLIISLFTIKIDDQQYDFRFLTILAALICFLIYTH